jgi:hypothetical protein
VKAGTFITPVSPQRGVTFRGISTPATNYYWVISDGALIADSPEYAQTPLTQGIAASQGVDVCANVILATARAGKS